MFCTNFFLVLLVLISFCNTSVVPPSDDHSTIQNKLRDILLLSSNIKNNDNSINDYIQFYIKYRVQSYDNNNNNNNNNNNIEQDIDNKNNEILQRFNQYLKNIEYINELNSDINSPNAGGYGITEYTDWFDDEIKSLYVSDAIMNKNNNNDNNNELHADTSKKCQTVLKYPIDAKRLKQNNAWGGSKCRGCKHQKKTNMCWAFATTLQYECNACKELNKCYEFSEQYGIDCSNSGYHTWASNKCNVGGFVDGLAAYYRDHGACFIYALGDFSNGKCNQCGYCAGSLRSRQCYLLLTTDASMITSAANKYALTFSMRVGRDFAFWKGGKKGSQIYSRCPIGGIRDEHGMTIIGQKYGKALFIQNSMGCDWGSNGRAWISIDVLDYRKSKCTVYNQFVFNSWYTSMAADDNEINEDVENNNDIEIDMMDMDMDMDMDNDNDKDDLVDNIDDIHNNNSIMIDYILIGLFLLSVVIVIYYYYYHNKKINANLEFEKYEPLTNTL